MWSCCIKAVTPREQSSTSRGLLHNLTISLTSPLQQQLHWSLPPCDSGCPIHLCHVPDQAHTLLIYTQAPLSSDTSGPLHQLPSSLLSSTDNLSWDPTRHEGIDQHTMITVRKGKREKGCEGWKKFHLSPLKTLDKDLMQDQHSHDSSFVPEWMDRHVSIQQRACSSSSSKQPLYWTQVICFLFLVCTYTLQHAHMFGRKYS